jgi:hypothetical protein
MQDEDEERRSTLMIQMGIFYSKCVEKIMKPLPRTIEVDQVSIKPT